MPPVVTVHGARELARTLRQAGEDLTDLKDANQAAGEMVAREAYGLAPKRSGALAGSIRAARQAAKAVVRVGSVKVPYAGPIHWGWPKRGIEANTFVLDAATAKQSEWLAAYEANIQTICDNVKGE